MDTSLVREAIRRVQAELDSAVASLAQADLQQDQNYSTLEAIEKLVKGLEVLKGLE